jgi:hypothetical protein
MPNSGLAIRHSSPPRPTHLSALCPQLRDMSVSRKLRILHPIDIFRSRACEVPNYGPVPLDSFPRIERQAGNSEFCPTQPLNQPHPFLAWVMAAWPLLLEAVHWPVKQNVNYNERTANQCQSPAHRGGLVWTCHSCGGKCEIPLYIAARHAVGLTGWP